MAVVDLPGIDVVREALRQATPIDAYVIRPWSAAKLLTAFFAGAVACVAATVTYDLRPVSAHQAVRVSAVVHLLSEQRHMTDGDLWRELRQAYDFENPQELSERSAGKILNAISGMIDPLTEGVF
jgi:hypothetical protein